MIKQLITEDYFEQAGFTKDEFGQLHYEENGLKIIAYHGVDWEIDITLPNGKEMSIDGGQPFPKELEEFLNSKKTTTNQSNTRGKKMEQSEISITIGGQNFLLTMSNQSSPDHAATGLSPGQLTGTPMSACEEFKSALKALYDNNQHEHLDLAAIHAFAHTAQSMGHHHEIHVKFTLDDGTEHGFSIGPDQSRLSVN